MARLLKRSGVSYTLVPAIVFACAILHSIVRERSDVGRTGVNGSRCSRSAPRGAESQLSRDQIRIAARSREELRETTWTRRYDKLGSDRRLHGVRS